MGAFLFKSEAVEQKPNRTIIYIEGNIGSGKSTLIEALAAKGYPVWDEGLEEFKDIYKIGDDNLLSMFYGDMAKHAFDIQIAWLTRRLNIVQEIMKSDEPTVFMERSLKSDSMTFAKLLHQRGLISDVQMIIYKELIKSIYELIKGRFNEVYLYLKVNHDICFDRKNERNRPEETTVPQEYLLSLEEAHNEWLSNEVIIDAALTKEQILTLVDKIAATFENY